MRVRAKDFENCVTIHVILRQLIESGGTAKPSSSAHAHEWTVAIAGFVASFFGMAVYNINQVSLRQAITPLRMQGRMNATMRFMVWGTMPIGAFVGGALGKAIGLRPTLWISAIGGLMCFVFPAVSPVRTLERIPEMSEDEPIPASIPGPIPTGS